MLESTTNNAIMTKARAMYGKRLTRQNYDDLVRKQSVSEIASYLKNETAYSDALSSVTESLIHRGQLENLLKRDLFRRYIRLCRFEQGSNNFFRYIFWKYEIEQILGCIRSLNADSPNEFISAIPSYMYRYTSFSLEELGHASSFSDLLKAVDKTPYHNILKPFAPQNAGELIDYTSCETALRRYYFEKLLQLAKSYKGKARKELENIFSIQAELENISNILRMKLFFQMGPEEIRKYLLPISRYLSEAVLSELIEAPDFERAVDILKNKAHFSSYIDEEGSEFLDRFSMDVRHALLKRSIHFSQHSTTVLASFVFLCELELENLTNIIECVRYGLAPSEMEKLLIM